MYQWHTGITATVGNEVGECEYAGEAGVGWVGTRADRGIAIQSRWRSVATPATSASSIPAVYFGHARLDCPPHQPHAGWGIPERYGTCSASLSEATPSGRVTRCGMSMARG